jgi:hypothetical protein
MQLTFGPVDAPDGCAKTGCEISLGCIYEKSIEGNHFAIKGDCHKRRHIDVVEWLDLIRGAFDFNLARRPSRVFVTTGPFGNLAQRKPRGHDETQVIAKGIFILQRFIDKERSGKLTSDAILGLEACIPRGKADTSLFEGLGLEWIFRIRNVTVETLQIVLRDFRLIDEMPNRVGQDFVHVLSRRLDPKGRSLARDSQCYGMTFRCRSKDEHLGRLFKGRAGFRFFRLKFVKRVGLCERRVDRVLAHNIEKSNLGQVIPIKEIFGRTHLAMEVVKVCHA